jgi:hypothetical protein
MCPSDLFELSGLFFFEKSSIPEFICRHFIPQFIIPNTYICYILSDSTKRHVSSIIQLVILAIHVASSDMIYIS